MEFKAERKSYRTRYFFGPGILLAITFGIFVGSLLKGFSFLDFINRMYFTSDLRSTMYLLGFLIILQVIGYFSTNKYPKLIQLSDPHLVINFFNGKTLILKYSEITSLEYTKDIFKNFEFTLKNGEKKMVYSTLSDNKKAFEEINKKINEVRK